MLGRLACLLPDCECTENPNSITLSRTWLLEKIRHLLFIEDIHPFSGFYLFNLACKIIKLNV